MSLYSIDEALNKMEEDLSIIKDKKEEIGTLRDGPMLQENIQAKIRDLSKTLKDTKEKIRELRLNNNPNVESYEEKFEDLSERIKKELPSVIQKLRESQNESRESSTPIVEQNLLSQEVVDQDRQDIEDLEAAVTEILSTMKELNQIFNQTLEKLKEQKNQIITLDNTISNAHDDVKNGGENLNQAQQHQKGSTKCLLWFLLIFLIVAAGIGIFCWIYFSVKKKNNNTPTPAADAFIKAIFGI